MTEIFVGPYVKILREEARIKRNYAVDFHGCTNPKCERHSNAQNLHSKFCPECGHKIEAGQQVKKNHDCLLDVAFRGAGLEPTDYAGRDGRYLFIMKIQFGSLTRDGFYEGGFGALDLSIFDKEKEMQWLHKELAEHLKVIDKEFGEGFYSIEWGVVDLS
jgi:hypothetical protein